MTWKRVREYPANQTYLISSSILGPIYINGDSIHTNGARRSFDGGNTFEVSGGLNQYPYSTSVVGQSGVIFEGVNAQTGAGSDILTSFNGGLYYNVDVPGYNTYDSVWSDFKTGYHYIYQLFIDGTTLFVASSKGVYRLGNAVPAAAPAPTLTCSAISSTAGNVVVINGNNLSGASLVQFGGADATNVTVISPTQITATVPFGATSGSYSVGTPTGVAACPNFTYIPTPPIINSFNPAFGINPQEVTISGTNFLGTTQVTFGGVPATIVSVTNTKIIVTLGVGTISSTPIDVAVTKPDGTASVSGFVYSSVPNTPVVASFFPECGTTGTVVTLTGTGLTNVVSVKFGGTPAAFTVISDTEIRATVKSGSSGAVAVSTVSASFSLPGFTFLPQPTITSFTPSNALAGEVITLNGTGFEAGCSITTQGVWIGGAPATSFTVVSPTIIQATVPAESTHGSVQIVRTDNSVARRTGFLFGAPTISGFMPPSGTTATAVTITGTNFLTVYGANGVQINGVNAASYTVNSDTQITAFPAATATVSGNIVVRSGSQTASLGGLTP